MRMIPRHSFVCFFCFPFLLVILLNGCGKSEEQESKEREVKDADQERILLESYLRNCDFTSACNLVKERADYNYPRDVQGYLLNTYFINVAAHKSSRTPEFIEFLDCVKDIGWDLDARSGGDGETLFQTAIIFSSTDVVEYLIQEGIDPCQEAMGTPLIARPMLAELSESAQRIVEEKCNGQ